MGLGRAVRRQQQKKAAKDEKRKARFRAAQIRADVELEGDDAPAVAKVLEAAGYPNLGADVVIHRLLQAALTAGMLTGQDAEGVANRLSDALEAALADKMGYDGRSWLEIEQAERERERQGEARDE